VKKGLIVVALCALAGFLAWRAGPVTTHTLSGPIAQVASDPIAEAFEKGQSNVQVEGSGVVAKVLEDDNDGSRHQRIIVRLASGQTILIAHNIDLAPRIDGVRAGAPIRFHGEYAWNNKGGLVHWTHRDPSGPHQAGWVEYAGRLYQ
jgi:uncharacterized protein DUF3465